MTGSAGPVGAVVPVAALPGVLEAADVRATAASIAAVQEPGGAVPWFRGGHVDPWDHVECAMALLVGGQPDAAERAYMFLFDTQRADGSWPIRQRGGVVEDPGTDANMCAYVAVGVWHHWLVRRDPGFAEQAWPVVRRALDLVVGLQLPFGGIAWARDASGRSTESALVAGSASIHHALRCGVALGRLLGEEQPEWQLAAARLAHALRVHEDRFEPKTRFSMDWYYPVLGGAVHGAAAERRLARRWDDFVVPGLGIRCVADRPWVTGAETCELVLALDAVGRVEAARGLLTDVRHLRDADGSCWTGYVYPDDARWPVEQSTWTAAAVVLATDALSRTTAGSGIFRGDGLGPVKEVATPDCGCADRPSVDRVAGVAVHSG